MKLAIDLVPHRPPFLLVDRVLSISGETVKAERRITVADLLYQEGLPELYVVEALAQTAACLMGETVGTHRGALVALRGFEFQGRALAGETLTLMATKQAALGPLHRFTGEARVEDRLVARGELTFSVDDPLRNSRGKRAVGGGSSELRSDDGGRERPPLNKEPSLYVVIPCFNGAQHVADVVRGARQVGPVVVIDDGSDDDSGTRAEEAGAMVLRHPANQGKGAALQTGFAYVARRGASAVLTMDADGQHAAADLPALVAAHQARPEALVVGVRSFRPEDMPRRSRIGNRISTWWISRFAGHRFQDTQSGFRIYPRRLFDRSRFRSHRFDTETELLLYAAHLGIPLVEVPVRTIYQADRVTHFHGFTDTLRVIRLVLFSPLWNKESP